MLEWNSASCMICLSFYSVLQQHLKSFLVFSYSNVLIVPICWYPFPFSSVIIFGDIITQKSWSDENKYLSWNNHSVILLGQRDHTTLSWQTISPQIFHKICLVHSWILCPSLRSSIEVHFLIFCLSPKVIQLIDTFDKTNSLITSSCLDN